MLAVVGVCVFFALRSVIRMNKNGCSCGGGCSGNCSSCSAQCKKK
ncbi:MAG: FeoB-associated Cys-rich membrane protein [Clostridia bacterium]|nr:FeoB-associated Cys-rich membrane protein [Clostridia bacterium]